MRVVVAGYGKGVASLDEWSRDIAHVGDRLKATLRSPAYRPPLAPKVALELHHISREPEADIARIAKVLESDPMLAAEVLGHAQATVVARNVRLGSLREAIARLGLVAVSNLFLQVAITAKVFRAPGYESVMDRLRRHSVLTAHLAARVARETSLFEEYAFLCGLLHDVGAAAALIALGEGRRSAPSHEQIEAEWAAVLDVHEELGTLVAERWSLPADVRWVIGSHHQRRTNGVVHPLVAIIAIAEHLSRTIEDLPLEPTIDEDVSWACDMVGVSPPALERLEREAASSIPST